MYSENVNHQCRKPIYVRKSGQTSERPLQRVSCRLPRCIPPTFYRHDIKNRFLVFFYFYHRPDEKKPNKACNIYSNLLVTTFIHPDIAFIQVISFIHTENNQWNFTLFNVWRNFQEKNVLSFRVNNWYFYVFVNWMFLLLIQILKWL